MLTLARKVVVSAPLFAVWDAWTTEEGVAAFGPRKARVELKVGGAYEWIYREDAPVGLKGTDGCTVLSYLPMEMLSFSWIVPPEFPGARAQPTWVVVCFRQHGSHSVEVTLNHLGWGEGEEWVRAHAYSDRTWDKVLARFCRVFGRDSDQENAREDEREKEQDLQRQEEEELEGG